MTSSTILCCECGQQITSNPVNMCAQCIRTRIDLTAGISKLGAVFQCRTCMRYLKQQQQWIDASLESPELLALCLKRVKGLDGRGKSTAGASGSVGGGNGRGGSSLAAGASNPRLTNAKWLWTEPHSKRLKIRLSLQAEIVAECVLEQECTVEFVVQGQQCEVCQKSYTEHTWQACLQLRQHVPHKRTFFFVEQLLLKHQLTENVVGIRPQPDGLDFFFLSKSHAQRLLDFLQGMIAIQASHSKRLISHDPKSNKYHYKFTIIAEIAPVCREDLVGLPPALSRGLPSNGVYVVTSVVGGVIRLLDPMSLRTVEVSHQKYWKNPLIPLATSRHLVEFVVMDSNPAVLGRDATAVQAANRQVRNRGGRRRPPPNHFAPGAATVGSDSVESMVPGPKVAASVAGSTNSAIRRDASRFQLIDVELARAGELEGGFDESGLIDATSHLGNVVDTGDAVLGYDMRTLQLAPVVEFLRQARTSGREVPRIVVVKKHYPPRTQRSWKLKTAFEGVRATNQALKDEQAFFDDLEQDELMLQHVTVYKNSRAAPPSAASQAGAPGSIPLDVMLDDFEHMVV